MDPVLVNLGLVVIFAAVFGVIARMLRQPPLLGYILAGFVVGAFFLHGNETTEEVISLFSHLGVAFLLFILGIELNVKEIKEVGLISLITGLGQVIVTSAMGFTLAYFVFGYEIVEASYIALGLTFSSTIIIIKLLGERGELNTLHGRIAVGLLIVQDIVAILALIVLSSLSNIAASDGSVNIAAELLQTLVSGVLIGLFIFICGRVVNFFLGFVAKSTELLLLVIIAWALFAAGLADYVGLSLEVGAFLAGLVLATSRYSIDVVAKIRPLRDFFIIMFFVALGTTLTLEGFRENIFQVGAFSFAVLIGDPLIMLLILGFLGYHRRVSFMSGLAVSQISEFSLILVATGVALGQVQESTLSVMTSVGIITFVVSSYLINSGDFLYKIFSPWLRIFERRRVSRKAREHKEIPVELLLVGGHQMGQRILDSIVGKGVEVLVIDYDPLVVKRLNDEGINAIYGDIGDAQLLDELNLSSVKVVVSTAPSLDSNLIFISEIAKITGDSKPNIVVSAKSSKHAAELKKFGADHTIVHEEAAGEKVINLLTSLPELPTCC